jgi:hypothetical protein
MRSVRQLEEDDLDKVTEVLFPFYNEKLWKLHPAQLRVRLLRPPANNLEQNMAPYLWQELILPVERLAGALECNSPTQSGDQTGIQKRVETAAAAAQGAGGSMNAPSHVSSARTPTHSPRPQHSLFCSCLSCAFSSCRICANVNELCCAVDDHSGSWSQSHSFFAARCAQSVVGIACCYCCCCSWCSHDQSSR